MSDQKKPETEKKIGLFKRLFGFGKPAPETTPTYVDTFEAVPPVDEQAARITAEIEEAKRVTAEANRLEQEGLAQEEARLKTEREALEQRDVALAQEQELARQELAKQELATVEAKRLLRDQTEAANAKAASVAQERAEQDRVAQEQTKAKSTFKSEQPAEPPGNEEALAIPAAKTSWWQRLKGGLSRTANTVSGGITGLFTKRKLNEETLEELEDILIQADLGIDVAARIAAAVGKGRYDKEIEPDEVKAILAEEVAKVLTPVAKPLVVDRTTKPFVILMVGVNGSGKTTTIGKLTSKFRAEGRSVMLAAGDTFRAAAIQQLRVWGDRTGTTVISRDQGADSSGLAFDALKAAKENNTDVLLIDTAGRLQNRTELMAELEKMVRVIKKIDATAPHAVLLVLDATVGQNALSQVEIFGKVAGVTGLVMTKLDGTARGGILVAIAEKFKLPVHFIGVGEGIDDLEPFSAVDFARAISGLEQINS